MILILVQSKAKNDEFDIEEVIELDKVSSDIKIPFFKQSFKTGFTFTKLIMKNKTVSALE